MTREVVTQTEADEWIQGSLLGEGNSNWFHKDNKKIVKFHKGNNDLFSKFDRKLSVYQFNNVGNWLVKLFSIRDSHIFDCVTLNEFQTEKEAIHYANNYMKLRVS